MLKLRKKPLGLVLKIENVEWKVESVKRKVKSEELVQIDYSLLQNDKKLSYFYFKNSFELN